jgi:N-acetyl-anhydromuramyl-L-alanine amidase AmpD
VKRPAAPPAPVHLPDPLPFKKSPNFSERRHGITPYLIVVHRPVGKEKPSISWLCNPAAQVSAHILTEGHGTGVDVATQLVPWDKKSWACAAFNSSSYNLEIDDDAWDGDDLGAAFTAARIVAFLCKRTGIPPDQSWYPLTHPGIVRHYDLGRAGGGHTDPTTDPSLWRWFLRQCQREFDRGGFRPEWGKGKLLKVKR